VPRVLAIILISSENKVVGMIQCYKKHLTALHPLRKEKVPETMINQDWVAGLKMA